MEKEKVKTNVVEVEAKMIVATMNVVKRKFM